MYDYGLSTLSQYDLTAERYARTRGALLCHTQEGLLIMREFHGSEKKLLPGSLRRPEAENTDRESALRDRQAPDLRRADHWSRSGIDPGFLCGDPPSEQR